MRLGGTICSKAGPIAPNVSEQVKSPHVTLSDDIARYNLKEVLLELLYERAFAFPLYILFSATTLFNVCVGGDGRGVEGECCWAGTIRHFIHNSCGKQRDICRLFTAAIGA